MIQKEMIYNSKDEDCYRIDAYVVHRMYKGPKYNENNIAGCHSSPVTLIFKYLPNYNSRCNSNIQGVFGALLRNFNSAVAQRK